MLKRLENVFLAISCHLIDLSFPSDQHNSHCTKAVCGPPRKRCYRWNSR